jgi:uncharacterized protein YjdB
MKKRLISSAAAAIVLAMSVSCGGSGGKDSVVPVTGVSLDNAAISLAVGEIGSLAAKIDPLNATNKAVKWESGSPEIAEVSGGGLGATVIAVSPGVAEITAKTDDGEKIATGTVSVTESAYVVCRGISLSHSEVTLAVGDSAVLVMGLLPPNATNQDARWASTFPVIADVTVDGLTATVTAAAPGTCVITVGILDGDAYFASSCLVSVVPAVPAE